MPIHLQTEPIRFRTHPASRTERRAEPNLAQRSVEPSRRNRKTSKPTSLVVIALTANLDRFSRVSANNDFADNVDRFSRDSAINQSSIDLVVINSRLKFSGIFPSPAAWNSRANQSGIIHDESSRVSRRGLAEQVEGRAAKGSRAHTHAPTRAHARKADPIAAA